MNFKKVLFATSALYVMCVTPMSIHAEELANPTEVNTTDCISQEPTSAENTANPSATESNTTNQTENSTINQTENNTTNQTENNTNKTIVNESETAEQVTASNNTDPNAPAASAETTDSQEVNNNPNQVVDENSPVEAQDTALTEAALIEESKPAEDPAAVDPNIQSPGASELNIESEENIKKVSADSEVLSLVDDLLPETAEVPSEDYVCSEDDIILLAQAMRHEAEGQSLEGKIAVVEVILNRVNDSRFPNTVKGVVYQSGQFSRIRRIKYIVPTEEELEIVRSVVAGENKVLDNPNVLYFRNPWKCRRIKADVPKNWGKFTWYAGIDDHAFYEAA